MALPPRRVLVDLPSRGGSLDGAQIDEREVVRMVAERDAVVVSAARVKRVLKEREKKSVKEKDDVFLLRKQKGDGLGIDV